MMQNIVTDPKSKHTAKEKIPKYQIPRNYLNFAQTTIYNSIKEGRIKGKSRKT